MQRWRVQLSDDTHGWKMSRVFNVESVWCEVLFLKRVKTHLTFGQSHVLLSNSSPV